MISRRIPTSRLFRISTAWLAGALVFVLMLFGVGVFPGQAQANHDEGKGLTEIYVSGEASATIMPDTATVVVAVETEAKAAPEAQEENARRIQSIIAALAAIGIGEGDIKTANFRLTPIRTQPPSQSSQAPQPPVIVGYRVSHDVRIEVTDIDRVGAVLDAAVGAGANRVSHIEFGVSDALAYRDGLLRAAMADAEAKASALAEAAGLTLLGPSRITESGYTPFLARSMARMAVADVAFAETEIMPDEQRLSVRIDVTFLAKRSD